MAIFYGGRKSATAKHFSSTVASLSVYSIAINMLVLDHLSTDFFNLQYFVKGKPQ